jgi:hypothetical protein
MKRLVAAGLLVLSMTAPRALAAQDTEWNRYTLEDLGGVHIRLEVAEPCEAAGVTASQFEADVATALMEAEVGVLTEEEMLEEPALPELRISIDCATGGNGAAGSLAYSVGLRVQQSAQMIRDTQITLPEAVTWYSTRVGVTDASSAAQTVESTLGEQLDGFITAWTEINSADEGGG